MREDKPRCAIQWLGQAGFLIRHGELSLLIDPYLSNSLAKKYAGAEFPHHRMEPPPVTPEGTGGIDLYLCTHRHSDHMDPETFPVVMNNNPEGQAVIPRALAEHAEKLGVNTRQLRLIDAGEKIEFNNFGITVYAIPSAHESIEKDKTGNHLFLGYVLDFKEFRIYHSGDCIPYPGLTAAVKEFKPNLALLPINGRDDFRRKRNVPGNFTIEEAVEICRAAGIPFLVPHHFGMFEFNTADMAKVRRIIKNGKGSPPEVYIPKIGQIFDCAIFSDHIVYTD